MRDDTPFDEAILIELDQALELLNAVATADLKAATADESDARRKLSLCASVDLFSRVRRLSLSRSEVPAKEKYQIIAEGIRNVLSAWGKVPPQFAKFYVPENVYEKLYPLYLKARDRAGGLE